jgi:hypothetical protein
MECENDVDGYGPRAFQECQRRFHDEETKAYTHKRSMK